MTLIATPLVNWSAIWKICLAALIGGSGVVIVFGFLLLGLKWATDAKSEGAKLGGYSLAAICAVFCTGAVVIGVIAMADKPSSKKPAKKSAAVLSEHGRGM